MNTSQKLESHSICKSSLAEAGYIETFDLEYHAQNAAMDIELTQLSKGAFFNSRDFLKLPGLFVSRQSWSRASTASGQVPPGCVMLGIDQHSPGSDAISWCGSALTKYNLAIARAGKEFEFTTSEHSKEALLLIDQTVLDTLLNENSIYLSDEERVLSISSDKWLIFRETLNSVIGEYINQPELLDDRAHLDNDRSALHELVARSLEGAGADSGRSAPRSTVKDALNILATMKEPITMRELANTLNVSQRTLESGFKKHVGMTPGLYTRRLRLNRAQQDLRAASSNEARVGDIAARWGFHHQGRFSVEYRSMFGEKPSSTLKKTPAYRSKAILRP